MDPTIVVAIVGGAVALGSALIPYLAKRRKDAKVKFRTERICFQCGDILATQFTLLMVESSGHPVEEADPERGPMLQTAFASLASLNVDEVTLDLVRARLTRDARDLVRVGEDAGATKLMLRDNLRLRVGDKAAAVFAFAFNLRLVEFASLLDPSAMSDSFISLSEEANHAGVTTTAMRPVMTGDELAGFARRFREKYQ